jgi:hypothetical protein
MVDSIPYDGPFDFTGFVENFNSHSHVFVANALRIVFEALDFVSTLSWTGKLISLVIVILFSKFILNFLHFLLFLPFKFIKKILQIIKDAAKGIIIVSSRILDWTCWPITIPVKLAKDISKYPNNIIFYFKFSKTVGGVSNISHLERFRLWMLHRKKIMNDLKKFVDKDFHDRLEIIVDLCVGFVIGCSAPGVYARAVIYIEKVDNQVIASVMRYSALFVGWLCHYVCEHWIISTALVVICSLLQFRPDGSGGGPIVSVIRSLKSHSVRNFSLLIGFFVSYETLVAHSFGVLNLSLFIGFLISSIKILLRISHSFGMGTFIIVAVAAYFFFGFPNVKFE